VFRCIVYLINIKKSLILQISHFISVRECFVPVRECWRASVTIYKDIYILHKISIISVTS